MTEPEPTPATPPTMRCSWWGLEPQDVHHQDCHYDAGYCDGTLCWHAAEADERALAAIAKYSECWYCGLPCDGSCEEEPDA